MVLSALSAAVIESMPVVAGYMTGVLSRVLAVLTSAVFAAVFALLLSGSDEIKKTHYI
jgi:hypothetical protein